MPRRRKTTPPTVEFTLPTRQQFVEALAQLTEKQRDFVVAVLDGKSLTQAYRECYDVREPIAKHHWTEASKLAADPKVALAIDRGVLIGVGSAIATLDDHTTQLRRLREVGLATGNVGAAVQAEQIRGKASGLLRDQVDINARVGDSDLITAISNGDPELAAKLRKALLGE